MVTERFGEEVTAGNMTHPLHLIGWGAEWRQDHVQSCSFAWVDYKPDFHHPFDSLVSDISKSSSTVSSKPFLASQPARQQYRLPQDPASSTPPQISPQHISHALPPPSLPTTRLESLDSLVLHQLLLKNLESRFSFLGVFHLPAAPLNKP